MAEAGDAPLRVLVIGEFAGESAAPSPAVPVSAEGFDAALAALAPALRMEVPDRIAGGPPLDLPLRFTRLADFGPAGLVERIPSLTRAREARELGVALSRGELDAAGFLSRARVLVPPALLAVLEARLAMAPAAPATSGTPPRAGARDSGASVESILAQVGTPAAGEARDAARRLVDSLASRGTRAPAGPAGAAIAELDDRIAAQLDAILHAAPFRRLEAAWRALRLLVARTDFRKPIELRVLAAAQDVAPAALRDAAAADALDFDLILAGYELDASARDHARARELALAGEETQTPVVVALRPEFFGLDSWAALRKARAPHATFEEAAYAAWRSLAEDDVARWLVLVANRVVLRAPFGRGAESARGLEYEESGAHALFGNPVFAVGAVLTRAFARTGHCLQISGTRNGLLSDLALVPAQDGDAPTPLEGSFGNERREDLERIGIGALQVYQRDIAFVGALRSFRRPPRFPDAQATADAAQQVTLAYQLYASRLAKFLGRSVPELVGLEGPDAVAHALKGRLVKFLSTPEGPFNPQRVGVRAAADPEDPGRTIVKLRVGPELTIGGREVNVLMEFALRG